MTLHAHDHPGANRSFRSGDAVAKAQHCDFTFQIADSSQCVKRVNRSLAACAVHYLKPNPSHVLAFPVSRVAGEEQVVVLGDGEIVRRLALESTIRPRGRPSKSTIGS